MSLMYIYLCPLFYMGVVYLHYRILHFYKASARLLYCTMLFFLFLFFSIDEKDTTYCLHFDTPDFISDTVHYLSGFDE